MLEAGDNRRVSLFFRGVRFVRRMLLRALDLSIAVMPRRFIRKGSVNWFIATEIRYGGFVRYASRNRISKQDHRYESVASAPGHEGGDRMGRGRHAYGKTYAQISKLIPTAPVVAELGVLRGQGLAIWADRFPQALIVGLDLDFAYFEAYRERLDKLGAFRSGSLALVHFDAFDPQTAELERLLDGRRIDLFVDDGPHDQWAIVRTFQAVSPLLAPGAVYVIEDAVHSLSELQSIHSEFAWLQNGGLVLGRRQGPIGLPPVFGPA